tara:strand:- start:3246 stop:3524 length:279 start_codon:yes stop_codon:yes gene_type:complete
MAFDKKNLNVTLASASGNAPKMFSYTTTDTAEDVNTHNYFSGINTMVSNGDALYLYADNDGSARGVLTYFAGVSATGIDIVDGMTIANTDTD